MPDLVMSRLQEWMLVIYAISLVFYFIDFLNKDKFAKKSAFWLLVLVFVMQTSLMILSIVEHKRFPVLSLFEGVYVYAWLLITASILLNMIYKVSYAVFFMNVIGFIFMTIHTFAPTQIKQSAIGESLVSELLFIHITFAILSYVGFAMTYVFAMLYLLLYKILKRRKWSKQFNRLPSLQQALVGMKVGMITGIPFLGISLILGMQWAHIVYEEFPFYDMKIFSSFFLLLIYGYILFRLQKGKLVGTNLAWANIFAFMFVVINFFLGSTLSSFHLWI